jgi:hypothetical protein
MSDWAASARIKADWAKRHIRHLEGSYNIFKNSDPYTVFTDKDPETGDHLKRVRIHHQPPIEWGCIVSDAIHNLRSSMDVLVYQFLLASKCKPSDTVGFPIWESRDAMKTAGHGEIQRCSEAAMDVIKAAEPYKGGKGPLWLLTRLNNADKHKLLIPVWGALTHIERDVTTSLGKFLPRTNFGSPRIHFIEPAPAFRSPLNDGAELYRVPVDKLDQMDMHPKFVFEIAFGEGEIAKREPLIKTLNDFAHAVDGVIASFSTVPLGRLTKKRHSRPSGE